MSANLAEVPRSMDLRIPAKMLPWLKPRRHKIARGGRGSAKSWTAAQLLVARGINRQTRWLCAREVQKSIKESSHRLLVDTINRMGLREAYKVTDTKIVGPFGTEFAFVGLLDHTADSIKSFEGFDGAWVEEAHTISARSANILIPTIRAPGSELWWTYNPDQETDFVHQMAARGDADTLVIDMNWRDNPWFPAELEAERLKMLAFNEDLYQHIWEGKCRSAAGLIFKRVWFKFYDRLPESLNPYIASDYAVTPEEDADGVEPDWTEHGVWGIDHNSDLYAMDWSSGQVDVDAGMRAWMQLVRRHNPLVAFEEKGTIHRSITGARNRLMRKENKFVHIEALASAGNKAARAMGFAARVAAGAVWLPRGEPWAERLVNQLCAFNGEDGRVDDMVDVCSLLARGLDHMANARPPTPPKPEPPKFGTEAWMNAMERRDERSEAERAKYYR